jgi:hypothetical protein
VKQIVRNEPNLPPAAPGSAGLIVQNEANSAANRAKRTQLGGPIVRNKANSPEAGRDGQGPAKSPMPAPRDQSVRNKANSAQAAGRTSTLWKKTYGELNMQETSVKQSQFAHRRHWAKAGKGTRAGGRTELYKQSQFAPDRLDEPLGRGRKCCHGRAQACKTKPIFRPGPTRWIWNMPPYAGRTRHAPICWLPLAAACYFGYKNGVFRSFGGPDEDRNLRMT